MFGQKVKAQLTVALLGLGITACTADLEPAHAQWVGRSIVVNRQPLSGEQLAYLQACEARDRFRLPSGWYWYDAVSGAWGVEGGPALGLIQAGMELGGRMPVNCSGGGTGVYVNGRELHPTEVAGLARILGRNVARGSYWLRADGQFGVAGQPQPMGNLWTAVAQSNPPVQRRGSLVSGRFLTGGGVVGDAGAVFGGTGVTFGPGGPTYSSGW